jgi:homoserine kinase
VSTKKARAVLPSSVAFGDAAANVARASLLVHALTTDPSRLLAATEDRLHQQARRTVYPESVDLVERLRAAGVATVISGAGPSVLALASSEQVATIVSNAGTWQVRPVPVSEFGAREVPIPPLP